MIGRSVAPALMYHAFCTEPPAYDPFSLFVTVDRFREQLAYLRKAGWRPLDVGTYLAGGRRQHRSFLLTIDDGLESVADLAAPILRDAGVPAVLFVPPALIGAHSSWMSEMPDAPIMSADALRSMAEYGIELGVHGLDHTDLAGLSDDELRRHTVDARDMLADLTGVRSRVFAYPRGVFDARAVEAVRLAGYDAAFSVFTGRGPFAIPRIDVNGGDTETTFRLKLIPGYRAVWHGVGSVPAARRLARRAVTMQTVKWGNRSTRRVDLVTSGIIEVHHGMEALEALGGDLDDLHQRCGVGISGRRAWLSVWAATHGAVPLAIVVRRSGSNVLEGAALLATTNRRGILGVHVLGHQLSDHVRFPCSSDEAARILGCEIAAWLRSQRAPWRVHLQHLDPADRTAAVLASELEWCESREGPMSLWTTIGPARVFNDYASKKFRKNTRWACNHLAAAGLRHRVEVITDADSIERSLPEVEGVRRLRDAGTGVVAELDSGGGRFWRGVVSTFVRDGQLFLAQLRIVDGSDDHLGGYVVGFRDGSTLRLWDGRINPRFAEYSPGRILYSHVLELAVSDPSISDIDWGRGDAEYKRWMSNAERPSVDLFAWSSSRFMQLDSVRARARGRLVTMKDGDPRLRRAWAGIRTSL